MKKLLCVFLLLTMFVTLISCQEEPDLREYSMDEILALPEFEGFSNAEDSWAENFEKYWTWTSNNEDSISEQKNIFEEILNVVKKSSLYVSVNSVSLSKYNEDGTEVQFVSGWELSSASLAKKAMEECPSLKALAEKNPDVQYLYGKYILIKSPVYKLPLAGYPDVEAALLEAGFAAVPTSRVEPCEILPQMLVIAENGELTATDGITKFDVLYSQNKRFEKNIDGKQCKIYVLRFGDLQYWEMAKPILTEYFGESYEKYTYEECVLVPHDMQYAESVAAMVDALKQ